MRQQTIKRSQRPPSRRHLLMMGIAGLSGILACAGGGIIGFLWVQRRRTLPRDIIYVTQTPPPTASLPTPQIISREQWGALPPNHDARNESGFYDPTENPEGWRVYDTALSAAYQTVVIHHSVVYSMDDAQTLLEIQDLHRDDRGWADVAYHFFVGKNGAIYRGRDWSVRGTHVGGYNTGSLGVCLLGNFMEEDPTPVQIERAQQLINWLAQQLQLTHLAGHRDFNDETLCPGDNLSRLLDTFADAAGLARGIDGYVPPDTATETPEM